VIDHVCWRPVAEPGEPVVVVVVVVVAAVNLLSCRHLLRQHHQDLPRPDPHLDHFDHHQQHPRHHYQLRKQKQIALHVKGLSK